MAFIKIQYYKTGYGELILGSYEEKLCLCDWRYRKNRETIDSRIKKFLKSEFVEETSTPVQEAILQLEEYFRRERKEFSIPILLCGTDFQQSVWNELLKIPYGKTETYLGQAKKMKNEKAIRAVASANGANAISIMIPCHRVIGSNGELTGYAGGLPTKKQLLEIETD
ncbi:MAG: methylated-DNA--[protein]-cysteine S-methyltransferase [Flavobacteriaceae bacterium]|jgi:methylated-DNA-[protein]-cysteine S-methyltransferase|nr:methylated-DNA--[protein]-cysteine S-methyltransferase [Flavobacteriaceae bacterium]